FFKTIKDALPSEPSMEGFYPEFEKVSAQRLASSRNIDAKSNWSTRSSSVLDSTHSPLDHKSRRRESNAHGGHLCGDTSLCQPGQRGEGPQRVSAGGWTSRCSLYLPTQSETNGHASSGTRHGQQRIHPAALFRRSTRTLAAMARVLGYLGLAALCVSSSGLAIYQPNNYGAYYPPSYQTYDRRLIDAFRTVAKPVSYSAYQAPLYGALNEYRPATYGSQTRTSFAAPSIRPLPLAYRISTLTQPLYEPPVKDDYIQAQTYTPNIYGKFRSDGLEAPFLNNYPKHDTEYVLGSCLETEDPCSGLPEGDYAMQGDFIQLFPGIDAQCNFVKCANYKAYVNPCSVGTKNGLDGGPDPKYGFCAGLDYDHYCGLYPAASDPYSRR
ncbi:hypothetical protein LSH36_153g01004, partial [Paralvinella palmiformis]